MNKKEQALVLDGSETLLMVHETSELVATQSTNELSSAAIAVQGSNALTNNVKFWNWMGRNFKDFASPASAQQSAAQSAEKANWMVKQLQGKGYEWDWITAQRNALKNLFKTFDAGDISNRPGSDITEYNILTGAEKEYQLKAYTSNNTPHLNNTPKDMTVVTNSEKVGVVAKNGYQDVQEFQNAETISKATEKRMKQVQSGNAQGSYTLKNVSGTMAKAGLVGCVVGMGVESVISYRAWKNGSLTNTEYLKEILKAGGDAGVTAAATSGVMIPVSATLTAAGVTSIITIPVAFAMSAAVNKIVAPCFGRGDYARILANARYYQSLDAAYEDMVLAMQNAGEEFYIYVSGLAQQLQRNNELKAESQAADERLSKLLDSI